MVQRYGENFTPPNFSCYFFYRLPTHVDIHKVIVRFEILDKTLELYAYIPQVGKIILIILCTTKEWPDSFRHEFTCKVGIFQYGIATLDNIFTIRLSNPSGLIGKLVLKLPVNTVYLSEITHMMTVVAFQDFIETFFKLFRRHRGKTIFPCFIGI